MATINKLRTDFSLYTGSFAPNSYRTTVQALSFIDRLPRFRKIADIGSGTGRQPCVLYEKTNSDIIAIDFLFEFTDYLSEKSRTEKLENRIHPILATPDNLPFQNEELDMIWAEAAVNTIEFGTALSEWNRFLKYGGYIGICSYCWLTDNHPEVVAEYWKNNEKDIESISCRIKQLRDTGFTSTAHFVMPDENWWNYFCPMENNFSNFLERHPDNYDAEKLVKEIDKEIDLYEKYGEYYGYVFFIGRKNWY